MSISRPLPKEVLKKIFLNILNERFKPNGLYRNHTHSYEGLINLIPHFLNIDPLSEKESYDAKIRSI